MKKFGIVSFAALSLVWLSVSVSLAAPDAKVIQELVEWVVAEGSNSTVPVGVLGPLGLPTDKGAMPSKQKAILDEKPNVAYAFGLFSVDGHREILVIRKSEIEVFAWRIDPDGNIIRTACFRGGRNTTPPPDHTQRFDETIAYLKEQRLIQKGQGPQ